MLEMYTPQALTAQHQPWPDYASRPFPGAEGPAGSYAKRTGVEQAESRITRLISDLYRQEEVASGADIQRFQDRRIGAQLALELVWELLRSYEGRE